MRALGFRAQMQGAPQLRHSNGMVLVDLDGSSIVFPSEAAARFFFEAYNDVPNLTAEVQTLRGWVDEGVLLQAQALAQKLTLEVEQLKHKQAELQARLVAEVKTTAEVRRRATILTRALRLVRDRL